MLKLFVKTQNLIQMMKDESGQDLIEYALIGGLLAVACIASMGTLATKIGLTFGAISTAL